MSSIEDVRVEHRIFEIGIILKLVNAILEVFGGLLFLFIRPSSWHSLVLKLTQHELFTDPRDIIANYLRGVVFTLTTSAAHFTGIYLLSHGLIKIVLIYGLLKKILYFYPASAMIFSCFIIYQLYRFTFTHSLWLIALSAFDLIVVIFTILEYNNLVHLRLRIQ